MVQPEPNGAPPAQHKSIPVSEITYVLTTFVEGLASLLGQQNPSRVLPFLMENALAAVTQPSEKEAQKRKPIHQNKNRSLPVHKSPENKHLTVCSFCTLEGCRSTRNSYYRHTSELHLTVGSVGGNDEISSDFEKSDLGFSQSDSEVDVRRAPSFKQMTGQTTEMASAHTQALGRVGVKEFSLVTETVSLIRRIFIQFLITQTGVTEHGPQREQTHGNVTYVAYPRGGRGLKP